MKHKKLKISALILAWAIILTLIASDIYVNDYYHANETAIAAMKSYDTVSVNVDKSGNITFMSVSPTAGFIFYPGGKVENQSYAPLMHKLAENGVLCVISKMPFNLAVLDADAADGIQEKYPEIKSWYISGHSLGGSMAAVYSKKHTDKFDGLILLAAYSTADIKASGLRVLSLYGSEDGVLNMDKYKSYFENLPDNTSEIVIEGGCHSCFGCYGEQKGDGTPTVTNEEQIEQTADYIIDFMSADN